MKLVVAADFHLTLKENNGVMTAEGLNSRVLDKLRAIEISVKYAVENKADAYISVGDEFDSLNPPELLRYKFIEVMSPLFKHNIPLYLVMGNHVYNAMYYNLMSEEKLLSLIGTGKMKIFSECTTFDIKGLPVSFIPWSLPDKVKEFCLANKDRIVFHHMPIEGALLNDYEIKSKDGLKTNILDTQKYWIGGHYHKFQNQDNWCYVGSIVKQDFGEREQPKGFIKIEILKPSLNLSINFIKIPDREFIQLKFLPPHDPIDFINNIKDFKDQSSLEPIIKVILEGDKSWLYSTNKSEIINLLEKKGALRVLPPEYRANDLYVEKPQEVSAKSNFDQNIITFCEKKNKTQYSEIMQDILAEVRASRRPE